MGGGISPGVIFYRLDGTQITLPNGSPQAYLVQAPLTGTIDWRRYVVSFTVPEGAARMKMDLHAYSCVGTVYFDSACIEPATSISTHEFDSSHTFDVKDTSLAGQVTETDYDARGRVTQTRFAADADASRTIDSSATYDSLDRLSAVSLAPMSNLGVRASYDYSLAGRLMAVTDSLGRQTSLSYNAAGQLTSVEDALGRVWRTDYDGLGRVKTAYHARTGTEAATPAATTS